MRSNYKRIGEFIQEVDERNIGLKVKNLLGLSISKQFIPSVANLIGTDMENYKIIRRNQFACSTMQVRRDKKMPVALLQNIDEAIISQAYPIFKVKDEKTLSPEYLMMWFTRSEFDREACFNAVDGVRGSLEWEDFCDMQLPIPSIAKQKEIVKEYNVIQNRIALNKQLIQKLEETAQAIYKHWFAKFCAEKNFPDGWRQGKLSDICEYSRIKRNPSNNNIQCYISTENMIQNRGGVNPSDTIPNSGSFTNFENGNILISNIRPYFKKIWIAEFNGVCSNDVLCFVPKEEIPPLYLYQILKKDNFFGYVMAGSKGTKMPRGDKKWIMDFPVVIPNYNLLDKYKQVVSVLKINMASLKMQNQKLHQLKELLLSKLATIEN